MEAAIEVEPARIHATAPTTNVRCRSLSAASSFNAFPIFFETAGAARIEA